MLFCVSRKCNQNVIKVLKFDAFPDIIGKDKSLQKMQINYYLCLFLFWGGIMKKTDYKNILNIVLRKKKNIGIIILISLIIGAIFSFGIIKKEYKASTTLILGRTTYISEDMKNEQLTSGQVTSSEIKMSSEIISTYEELVKSNTSIKEIKESLNIEISQQELRDSIEIRRVDKTNLVEITVKSNDSNLTASVANKSAEVLAKKVKEIYKISQMYIIDPAQTPDAPYNVNYVRDFAIALILGVIASVVYIVLLVKYDTTIKSAEDIEEDFGIKILSAIPNKKEKKQALENLINFEDEKSSILDSFKTLRTNVQFLNINNKSNKVMLITSCFTGEGKSYVAANLATVFAKAGKKVILIDMDMRVGVQGRIFGIPNHLGISNYLSGIDTNGMEINERINSYIKETSIKNLNVITSGTVPPNPTDLLSSEKLPELIKDLSVFYDIILIDGAPTLPVADSLILSTIAGSTILVAAEEKTKNDELKKAKRDLQNVGGRLIGVVLNQATVKEKKENESLNIEKVEEKINQNENKKENKKTKKKEVKHKVLKIKEWILNHINFYKKKEELLLLAERKEAIDNLKENFDANNTVQKEEITNIEEINEIQKEEIISEKEIKRQEKIKQKQEAKLRKEEERLKRKIEREKVKEEKQKEKEEIEISEKEEENLGRQLEIELTNTSVIKENKSEDKLEKDNSEEKEKSVSEKEKINIKENILKVAESVKNTSGTLWNKFKNSAKTTKETLKEYRVMKKIEQAEKQKIKDEENAKKELAKNEELLERQKEEAILAEEREKEKLEKDKKVEEEKAQKELLKQERKNKKLQEKEEKKKYKEEKRKKQKQEAKIQEELLDDNLYPKTKYNKNL